MRRGLSGEAPQGNVMFKLSLEAEREETHFFVITISRSSITLIPVVILMGQTPY